MDPACVFTIILLACIVFWIIVDGGGSPRSIEYLPSGAVGLDSTTYLGAGRPAGPLPLDPSAMLYPPWNPVANDRIPRDWADVPIQERYNSSPGIPGISTPINNTYGWTRPRIPLDLEDDGEDLGDVLGGYEDRY